jgi:4-hydroxybenzoate polyprenyltransferase
VIIPTALFYYSYKYKYLPLVGNIVVSLLAALTVFIYWLFEFYSLKKQPDLFIEASLIFPQLNRFVLSFALFAFLTTLIREIIKDTQDMEGDSRFGCRTLPVIAGIPVTRAVLVILELTTLAALAWFQVHLYHSGYTLMSQVLFLADGLLIYAVARSMMARKKKTFAHLSLVIKLVMVAGMLSLITSWIRV